MSNLSTFLLEAGCDVLNEAECGASVTIPMEMKVHPRVVSETGTSMVSYFTVELAFEDEEAEAWVVDGEPIRGFGDTAEEAMEQFMMQMHKFACEVTEPYHLSEDESALLTMLDA